MLEKVQIVDKITLKEARKLTGLSQEEFAKKVDIPLTSYRRYENDLSKMEVGKLFHICEIIGIDVGLIRVA